MANFNSWNLIVVKFSEAYTEKLKKNIQMIANLWYFSLALVAVGLEVILWFFIR